MTEYDALLAAICANPDEDTLRLAFADWLEEHEEPERAAFVRAQVELARTPPWEPFAVHCRWRQKDWVTGQSFLNTLPALSYDLAWNQNAFRRGLGWHLDVRSLLAWEQLGERLLDRVPVGEMHLWGSTLDDWRRFATSRVLNQLRRVHFVSNPIEPLHVMRENPSAQGITDLFFERASGAGMPEVLKDLNQSPLGRVVRGLHFRVGYGDLDYFFEALVESRSLERLSLSTMGLTSDLARRWAPALLHGTLKELHLRNEPLEEGLVSLVHAVRTGIEDLSLSNVSLSTGGLEHLARVKQFTTLRRLDLSRNTLTPRAAKLLAASQTLMGLRSLCLTKCGLGDRGMRHLVRAKFWPSLVELDLRENPISRTSVGTLLDAPPAPYLTALVLDRSQIGPESEAELRKKYGERLVLDARE